MFSPNPSYVKTAGNIFVIGDVHGNYNAFINLLINNKIIDADLKWIFGDGQFIQLGDVFDRGAYVTETLWFLYSLQIQARNSGGDVHMLLGNHEIMALTGDHRYLNAKYEYFTHYTQTEYFRLFDTNSVLGRWLRCQNIILRINDYLCMHAGISPEFAAYGYAYPDINLRVRNYLNSDDALEEGSPEDIILGASGPLWYRGYMDPESGPTEVTLEFIDNYFNLQGLKRMVFGHNEQRTIKKFYGGKIISADVALDESGNTAQGLLISGDEIYRCFSDGITERLE
jgi:hypothetical protein